MIIDEHLDEKYVVIWVANYERRDEQAQESIRKIINENHQKKIKTVIFYSGKESLREQTANLLDLYAEKSAPNRIISREDIGGKNHGKRSRSIWTYPLSVAA